MTDGCDFSLLMWWCTFLLQVLVLFSGFTDNSSRASFTAFDYYQFDDLLSSEERVLRKRVRGIMEKEVAPIMAGVTSYHSGIF